MVRRRGYNVADLGSAYLFGGRFVAGLSIGSLTHIVPMYIAEVSQFPWMSLTPQLSPPNVRGSLVALQQLSITLGILFSCECCNMSALKLA